MQSLYIVLMSVAAAVGYGILHDLFTAHICVEYFTIGHPPVFHTQNPILLALGWGVIATWWVGLPLGILTAAAARIGPWPRRDARSLIRPMLILLAVMAAGAALSGLNAAASYSGGLIGICEYWARHLPPAAHRGFIIDAFCHNASYFLGAVGGGALCAIVWISRIRIPRR